MKASIDELVVKKEISRRTFIDWILKGGFAAMLAGLLAPALTYLWPVMRGGPVEKTKEIGRVEDIPVWSSKKVIVGGSALLVIRTPKTIKAYSAICTHLGCIVEWNDSKRQIDCPCHAGFFDVEGRVVSGPPPQPLQTYPVKVSNGKMFITL